jgi:histidinol phosphatase-like PHP family hydrolase
VYKGTNKAAILAGCDILAHPGLISPELATLAAEKNVMLELSLRKGSAVSNGHIMNVARNTGANVIVNSDAHSPSDFFTEKIYREVALGAGMSEGEFNAMVKRLHAWLEGLC